MAKYIEGQHIENLQKEQQLVFWTKGNAPTQRVNNLTYEMVLNNLKLLYLLSGKIIASASYFFESPITQQVTDSLKSFFEEGEIIYFFDENLDSPTEHAERKISKSPKGLSVYRNKKMVLTNAKKLETFGNNLLRRPPLSISDKMVKLWINEISSNNNNSIGAGIVKEVNNETKQNEIKDKLITFANNRDKDFVWEYIEPLLMSSGLKNPYFHNMIKKKLSQMYAFATANVLGVELDEKLNYDLIDKNSKYDTTLFAACLKQIGLYDLILQLDNNDLKQLKTTIEFAIFRNFYFEMIEDCKFQAEKIRMGIDAFKKFEIVRQNQINREEFIGRFAEYSKLLKYPSRKFKKRLDEIRSNFEMFGVGIISNVIPLVKTRQAVNAFKEVVELKIKEYKKNATKPFLFVTANENEKEAFEKKFEQEGINSVKGATYMYGKFGNYPAVWFHMQSQGTSNADATILCGDVIREVIPVAVVMVGIAFGADENTQKIGDVLVSKVILNYDSRKEYEGYIQYKELPKEAGFRLFNAFNSFSYGISKWEYPLDVNENKRFKLITGAILTGSALIDDCSFKRKLLTDFSKYKPIGGEMEAYGIYAQCRSNNISEWIIVKAICDWGCNKQNAQKDEWQKIAADSAVNLCYTVFSFRGGNEKGIFDDLYE